MAAATRSRYADAQKCQDHDENVTGPSVRGQTGAWLYGTPQYHALELACLRQYLAARTHQR